MVKKRGISKPPTQLDRAAGILAIVINLPKTEAQAMMVRIMQDVLKASMVLSMNIFHDSSLLTSPIIRAPAAPAPPACVGVKKP